MGKLHNVGYNGLHRPHDHGTSSETLVDYSTEAVERRTG